MSSVLVEMVMDPIRETYDKLTGGSFWSRRRARRRVIQALPKYNPHNGAEIKWKSLVIDPDAVYDPVTGKKTNDSMKIVTFNSVVRRRQDMIGLLLFYPQTLHIIQVIGTKKTVIMKYDLTKHAWEGCQEDL